jgi:hypothetical protein
MPEEQSLRAQKILIEGARNTNGRKPASVPPDKEAGCAVRLPAQVGEDSDMRCCFNKIAYRLLIRSEEDKISLPIEGRQVSLMARVRILHFPYSDRSHSIRPLVGMRTPRPASRGDLLSNLRRETKR